MFLAFGNFRGILTRDPRIGWLLISATDTLKRADSGTRAHDLKQSVGVRSPLSCLGRSTYLLQTGSTQSWRPGILSNYFQGRYNSEPRQFSLQSPALKEDVASETAAVLQDLDLSDSP